MFNVNIVNLTPHPVHLHTGGEVITFPETGTIARVATDKVTVPNEWGLPLVTVTFGEVQDLPDPQPNTLYIVSGMIMAACPHRTDIIAPDDPVRNEAKQIVGCRGFSINRA